jgi:trimeric autotransporter adhesin
MPKKLEIKKVVLTGNVSSGSAVITNLSSTTELTVGDLVFGTGIPSTTRILTKDSSTQITLDKNATSSGTGISLTFATDDILVKNSDLLDGYHANVTTSPSTIPVRDSNENIATKSANLLWLDFAVNPGTVTETEGRVYYNYEDDTLNIVHRSGAVQQVGQEFFFPPTNNNSGVQINNGEFVMATGATGDKITIAKAITNGTVDPIYMIGVANRNIPNGSELGKVITNGLIRGFNTNAWTVGTVLYPNPAVAGGWTSTKPTAPSIKTAIAIVIKQNSSSGILYIRMTNGSKLGDTDSNVEFTSLADKQMIAYNATNTRWENTNGLNWDFANSRLGISVSSPTEKVDVSGTVKATAFSGSGASLTSLSASNISSGTLSSSYGGTGVDNGGRTLTLSTNNFTLVASGAARTLTVSGANKELAGAATVLTFGGNFTHTGAHTLGITTTANTSVTFPTSGTLMTNPMTTLGDVIYGAASGAPTRLAGNTTTTKQFLSQTGNGTASAAPSWSAVSKSDVGLSNVENTALSTWTGSTNITTLGTISSGTWSAGTIAVNRGGTGQTSYTNGQLLIGNTTGNTLTKATLTAGSGISITNGAGSITISSTVAGLNEITVTNDATTDIPLIVNAITSTTAALQSWRVNNSIAATLTSDGSFFGNYFVGNYLSPNLGITNDVDINITSTENDIRLYPYATGVYVNDTLSLDTSGFFVGPGVSSSSLSLSSAATTSNIALISGNSLTSGNGLLIQSTAGATMTGSLLNVTGSGAMTTGDLAKFQNNAFVGSTTSGLVDILSTSTARANQSSLLNISSSGANASSTREVRAGQFSVTNTGTASTNTALYLNASGGTTNRALSINSGEIYQVATASNTTTYRVYGNGYDVNLLRVSNSAQTDSADFGYSLRYIGTGTGNANYLDLYADNQSGSQVLALRVDQAGTLTAGSTISHSGLVTTSGTNIDQVKELTTASTTWTTTWQDIATVSGTYLATGSHMVQALLSGEYYTGNFSWFSGSTTTTTTDEIVLQRAGPTGSPARLFLRVARKSSGVLTLQASTSSSITAAITLKFRRLI